MRKLLCVLGLVCLASVGAAAQDVPRVDLFAGYSYVHTGPGVSASAFNANGGVGSIALNLTSWGSLVGEVGGIHASKIGLTDVDATAMTFLAGPKIALFQRSSLSPFVQALAGVVRTNPGFNQTLNTHYTFAFSPGAGLDWNAHAPRRDSPRPDRLSVDAHPHIDQSSELEQFPVFGRRGLPFLDCRRACESEQVHVAPVRRGGRALRGNKARFSHGLSRRA